MPALIYHTGAFVIADTAYVGLGFSGSTYEKRFYKYIVSQDKWINSSNIPGRGRNVGACFSLNGFGYVAAGWTGNAPSEHLKDVYKYDPANGSWTKLNDYPGYATDDVFSFVVNGKAYVGGGFNIATPINELWEYNPQNDTWTKKKNMIDGIARGVAFSIGKYGYVVSGQANKIYRNENIYRYDTELDLWEDLGKIPLTPTLFPFAFVLNGKAYIGGGWVNDSNQFWEFNPQDNTFRPQSYLPYSMHGCAAFVIGGRAFVQDGSTIYSRFYEYLPSDNYITTDSVDKYLFCEDSEAGNVYFSYKGNYNSDNIFQLELSTDLNNYTDKVIIAQGKSSPIKFDMPKKFSDNTYTKLRVISSSPETFGNYTIKPVNMQHYPAKPVLTLKKDTLWTSNYGNNYWFRNGILIDSTKTRYIKLKEFGKYKSYSTYGCPSEFSDEFDYSPNAVEDPSAEIYSLNGRFLSLKQNCDRVEVYDLIGRKVEFYEINSIGISEIEIRYSGFCFVVIKMKDGQIRSLKNYFE